VSALVAIGHHWLGVLSLFVRRCSRTAVAGIGDSSGVIRGGVFRICCNGLSGVTT
jgi:hypothetical protein